MMTQHCFQPMYLLLNMGCSTTIKDDYHNTWLHMLCRSLYYMDPDYFQSLVDRRRTGQPVPEKESHRPEQSTQALPLFAWLLQCRDADGKTPMDCLHATWEKYWYGVNASDINRGFSNTIEDVRERVQSCLEILVHGCKG